MGLPKGRTNNKEGRPTGTPNKVTKEIRDKFKLLVEDNIDKLQTDLDQLEPKERIKLLLELSKFVVPTLKATDLSIDSDVTISFDEAIDYSKYSTEDLEALNEIAKKYEQKKI